MKHALLVLAVIATAAAALALALVLAPWTRPRLPPTIADARPLPPGGDFTLTSSEGPLALAELRGRVVLLAFGYTYCPDICPTTLNTVAEALRALPPSVAAQIVPVFVSFDPERDTPTRLAEYVRYFHPALVGVTGTPVQLASVAELYEVVYVRVVTPGGYTMDHSAELHLLGRDGRPAARLPHEVEPRALAKALQQVVAARGASRVTAVDPYVRLPPPGSVNTAAFMRLYNPTTERRAVVAVTSAAARTTELHAHLEDGGVMRMRRIERIDLPPASAVALAPGGLHVMLFELIRPLRAGEPVTIELQLDNGEVLRLDAPVRGAARSPVR